MIIGMAGRLALQFPTARGGHRGNLSFFTPGICYFVLCMGVVCRGCVEEKGQ